MNSEMGYVSAEKQMPSALDIVGSLSRAVEIQRRQSRPGSSKALRDLLSSVVTEYNKLVTNKKHRIDSGRKTLAYNLFLGCFALAFHPT